MGEGVPYGAHVIGTQTLNKDIHIDLQWPTACRPLKVVDRKKAENLGKKFAKNSGRGLA